MSRNLHHANLLVGAPEDVESYLHTLCASIGIGLPNNPDFFAFKMETFGIDEARDLRLLSTRKAVGSPRHGGVKKIFLITSRRLTLEAQNALLKTFEDPGPRTYFFLGVREEGLVVPTLRSRMQVSRVDTRRNLVQAEEFLSLSLKGRLLFAKKFADEEMNLSVFLDNLLFLLKKRKESSASVRKVCNMVFSIGDAIVAPRLVIEHLALVL